MDEKPEWIEVVEDLFLNLLSQNSHVFPRLCGDITFHQILKELDYKKVRRVPRKMGKMRKRVKRKAKMARKIRKFVCRGKF